MIFLWQQMRADWVWPPWPLDMHVKSFGDSEPRTEAPSGIRLGPQSSSRDKDLRTIWKVILGVAGRKVEKREQEEKGADAGV